jgi:hypothetical protein
MSPREQFPPKISKILVMQQDIARKQNTESTSSGRFPYQRRRLDGARKTQQRTTRSERGASGSRCPPLALDSLSLSPSPLACSGCADENRSERAAALLKIGGENERDGRYLVWCEPDYLRVRPSQSGRPSRAS